MKRLSVPRFTAIRSLLRWRYVIPRALVVLAIYSSFRFGLDPLIQWTLVSVGEAALGAKVDVGRVETSILGGEIIVGEFAATNPQKPMRNLVEAEQFRLKVDGKQLLRKRVVVHDGSIAGLRFDTDRSVSGAIISPPEVEQEPSALDPVFAAAEEKTLAWFDDLSGRLQQDLMASLATPQVLEDIETRWPQQYEALKARAEGLRARSKEIESRFREAKKNPLRSLPQLDQLQRDLATTEADLRKTLAELKALPGQAKADRQLVDDARKKDEQFFREHLKLSGVDPDELNRYLLGETATHYLTQTAWWIDQTKKLIPKSRIAPPDRTRGTNVLYSLRKQPAILIERLGLEGEARLNGRTLHFAGDLLDAASEPSLHERPLRLQLDATGAFEGDLLVELDRRGATPHDSLVVDIPRLTLAPRALGKADKLAINVTSGEACLKADIKLDGDALSGEIWVRQSSTLSAATPMLRDDRIAQVLHESVSGVDRLEATVRLAGTLKRPDVRIESNLGPQLASGLKGAVHKYLADRRERLVAKLQGKVDEQLARLEAKRAEAEKELVAKLGEDHKLLTQLAALAEGQLPISPGALPTGGIPKISIPQLGGNPLDQLRK